LYPPSPAPWRRQSPHPHLLLFSRQLRLGCPGPVRFRGGQGLSSPVSSHSIVLPNSRAILSKISAPTSTFRVTSTRRSRQVLIRYNEDKALLWVRFAYFIFRPFRNPSIDGHLGPLPLCWSLNERLSPCDPLCEVRERRRSWFRLLISQMFPARNEPRVASPETERIGGALGFNAMRC
jgi:hypothetical protein